MSKDYVTQIDGAYRIADTRISLDSAVYAFLNGQTPESIADSFPLLTLKQVCGAIAFYLAHRADIDAYVSKERRNSPRFVRLLVTPTRYFIGSFQKRDGSVGALLMKIRFQADADLNQIILQAVIRREPNIDFLTAEAADLVGLKDPEVLAVAAQERRVLSLARPKNHAETLR